MDVLDLKLKENSLYEKKKRLMLNSIFSDKNNTENKYRKKIAVNFEL